MDLYFYDSRFKEAIEDYQLSAIQLRYTTRPLNSISLSKESPNLYPILAIEKENLITYMELHKNEGVKPYSNNEHAILLKTFSTDFRYQGKGYGQKAIRMLPDFLHKHFPEINEIILTVNLMNKVARGLYKKCGFVDKGRKQMGIKGELIIMSKMISE